MFGKSLSEYVAFQNPILVLIAAVWALRLVLSIAGVPVPVQSRRSSSAFQ